MPTPLERFHISYDLSKTSGCWEWSAGLFDSGYAAFNADGRTHRAHRWYYQQVHGPLHEKQVLHHECHNKCCVNPNHLRALSQREHILETPKHYSRTLARRSECKNGHLWTDSNTRRDKAGHRECRACDRERTRNRRLRARAA